jgi:hypothetical protein
MITFAVINVARQVEGDLMLVRVERAFTNKNKAQAFLSSLPKTKSEVVKTEAGEIECFCVRGIYEFDVEVESDEGIGPIAPPAPTEVGKLELTPEMIAKLMQLVKN